MENEKQVVIVMTSYNREDLLNNTLESIEKHTKHSNFEIVIVDDFSEELPEIKFLKDRVHLIQPEPPKRWINPEPAYNTGIVYAFKNLKPDFIILQNAEGLHASDIISYTAQNITDENYVSFACYSLPENADPNNHTLIPKGASHNGEDAWYNHSIYNPRGLEFCAAMSANTMLKLNGYDERFSDGYAWGDDYLLNRVKQLPIDFKIIDDYFVFHQWHYGGKSYNYVTFDKEAKFEQNRVLFEKLKNTGVKAEHLYTPNLDEI